jgi:hypothetical protein
MSTTNPTFLDEFTEGFFASLKRLFTGHQRSLITILRQPSPIKITEFVTANSSGTIGGGFTTPNPVLLWQCPMSHEAWINRFTITSPQYSPANALTTGEAMFMTNLSTPVYFLPIGGDVAPVQINEGRLSAPHFSAGEQLVVVGDALPANVSLRVDLQITLVSGLSADTPAPEAKGILE